MEHLCQCPEMEHGKRHWQKFQPDHTQPPGSVSFTLMTYNILSQKALDNHSYLYTCIETDHRRWEKRCKRLLEQILAHRADVICLQEVEEDSWMSQMKERLEKEGYGSFYKKKPGDKTDGCVLLYKREKFRLVKAVGVDMNRGGILDRNNTGIIALLSPEGYTGSVPWICVASTHLLFNPHRGDVKLSQLVLFLAEIDKMAYRDPEGATSSIYNSYCPIIFCGDLNSEPYSDFYNFVTSGYLYYRGLVSRLVCGQYEGRRQGSMNLVDRYLIPAYLKISQNCRYKSLEDSRWRSSDNHKYPEYAINTGNLYHAMNFKSVYKHHNDIGVPELTTFHNLAASTVDYIFYSSPSVTSRSLNLSSHSDCNNSDTGLTLVLMARYSLPTIRDLDQRLPNDVFPSDHFCLIAKFLLR